MANNSIHTDMDLILSNIYITLCNAIADTQSNVSKIKSEYNTDLVNLISVLKINQDDINFLNKEGQAIGEYFKSKGCTKDDIEVLVKFIISCFDSGQ